MTLYISIGLILFCLALARLTGIIHRRYEIPLALCITVLAWVVSFVRWRTGTDWDTYLAMYQQLTSIRDVQAQVWWGPGYAYLALVMNSLGAGYTALLFCVAVILFWGKFHVMKRTCAAPLVAIFVLYCLDFYDIFFVRESVAAVFLWVFAYYFYRRAYRAATAAALTSIAFHYSAALPIAIVVLLGRFGWKRVFVAVLVVGTCSYALRPILDRLQEITTLTSYIGSGYVEQKASALSTTLRASLKSAYWLVILAASYSLFGNDLEESVDPEWNLFCLRCAAGIMLMTVVLLPFGEIFARFPIYAYGFFAVVLSGYRFRLRRLTVAGAVYLTALVVLFIELISVYRAYPDLYYPIRTILG